MGERAGGGDNIKSCFKRENERGKLCVYDYVLLDTYVCTRQTRGKRYNEFLLFFIFFIFYFIKL